MKISTILEEMRPKQWVKNLLVFTPLIFARKVGEGALVFDAFIAFLSFCFAASSVYMINDVLDMENDKLHPRKKERPVASGRLPSTVAVKTAILLTAGSILVVFVSPGLGLRFVSFPVIYIVLNISYSVYLKHVVIVDAIVVALGFLLRVIAGGEAIRVPCSSWLIICTLFVSLLISFLKRRTEMLMLEEGKESHRKVLEEYDPDYLNIIPGPLAALTVMAYSLYTVDPQTVEKFGSRDLLLTIPFVIFGVFRYLYLTWSGGSGSDPTSVLLKDKPIIINTIIWFILCLVVIYGHGPGI